MEMVAGGGRLDDPPSLRPKPTWKISLATALAAIGDYLASLARRAVPGLERLLVHAGRPSLLGLIRILTGFVLLYDHAIWGVASGFLRPRFLDQPGSGRFFPQSIL